MRGGDPGVALAWSVHATCAVPLILFGTLAVSIRGDLHFGTGEQGLAAAGIVLVAAATTAWAGRLVDRSAGPRWMSLGAAVTAVALMGSAVTARSFITLVPWMAIAGLGLGVAQPASDAFLHAAVRPDRQGRAFSLKQALAGPGVGLVAGLAVPVAAAVGGWRNAFLGASLLAVIVAGAATLRTRATVRSVGVQARTVSGGALPLRPLMTLALAGGMATAPQVAFVAFAVSSAAEYGMDQATAGLLFSASCVPAIAVRLLFGRRVDRRARTDILALVATVLVVSGAGFVLMSTGWTPAVVVAMPLLAATAWGWHGLFFLVAVRTSPAAPGRAAGIAGSGTLIGAVIGPPVFGLGAEWSFAASWLFTGVFSLAAAGSMLLARRTIIAALGPSRSTDQAATRCQPRLSRPS